MDLTIVSPYTHLSGHYWPYTTDFLSAVAKGSSAGDPKINVFAAKQARSLDGLPVASFRWHACFPWFNFLLPDSYRDKNWGNKPETIARITEFHFCLRAALKHAEVSRNKPVHIHCIESRHKILLDAVLKSRHSFSSLCVGAPPSNLTAEREKIYRTAFNTNRLKFIVETAAVRKAWEYLAGEHVIHIPAALPWKAHEPKPQKLARRHLELPADRLVCLFFGTHREGKDYDLCIRAAVESGVTPFLLFAGPLISGNDPDALLSKYGYKDSRSIKEFLPDDAVPDLFDACDAVMLPYSNGYSKGSAVLLQAAHFEKPVIAPNTGHLGEFVHEYRTGELYEPGNLESLVTSYRELSSAKSRGDLANQYSFLQAKGSCSWDSLIPRYRRVFEHS